MNGQTSILNYKSPKETDRHHWTAFEEEREKIWKCYSLRTPKMQNIRQGWGCIQIFCIFFFSYKHDPTLITPYLHFVFTYIWRIRGVLCTHTYELPPSEQYLRDFELYIDGIWHIVAIVSLWKMRVR